MDMTVSSYQNENYTFSDGLVAFTSGVVIDIPVRFHKEVSCILKNTPKFFTSYYRSLAIGTVDAVRADKRLPVLKQKLEESLERIFKDIEIQVSVEAITNKIEDKIKSMLE